MLALPMNDEVAADGCIISTTATQKERQQHCDCGQLFASSRPCTMHWPEGEGEGPPLPQHAAAAAAAAAVHLLSIGGGGGGEELLKTVFY